MLEGAPKPATVFQHRYRRAVKFRLGTEQARLCVFGRGPSEPAIGGASDDGMSVVPVGTDQIQCPVVGEERGPELAIHPGNIGPGLAPVSRSEQFSHRPRVLTAARAKLIVGGDIIDRGKHRQTG